MKMNHYNGVEAGRSSREESAGSRGLKAHLVLDIVVVGCGLGGLAAAYCLGQAGHNVTVLEAASAIGEVGAGIQIGPNVTRLLVRWGLESKLEELAVLPQAITFRRYENGERVGWTKWGDVMVKDHGAKYYHIHRADLHDLLFGLASPFMNLRLNSRVISIDPTAPSLTLESGEVINADLIIGADGVKSTIREVVVGCPDKATPTGDAAYRAIIPADAMLKDPVLKHLVDEAEMTGWMGPKKHIMAYCIRGKKEYNFVAVHPDDGSTESWTAEVSTDKMREEFAGWEPRIQKLLALVPKTLNWKLMDRAPLKTWVHPDGRVALLGDACHPMLPYRAQGAAMAIEDAVVLGSLFSHLTHRRQIVPMLHAYQEMRYPRTTSTQMEARMNQKIFHLEDGPEQQARDDSMREGMEAELRGEVHEDFLGNANLWADKERSKSQFTYDAGEFAERWWSEHGERLLGEYGVQPKM